MDEDSWFDKLQVLVPLLDVLGVLRHVLRRGLGQLGAPLLELEGEVDERRH